MKDKFKVLILIILLLLIIFIVFFSNKNNASLITNDIDIYFFKTYESDASIIKNKDSVIMIDTGLDTYGNDIVNRMKELGITKIDYLILSHNDKDHIGNVIRIIDNFIVKKVIINPYLKNSDLEKEMFFKFEEKDIPVIKLDSIYKFTSNGIKVITYPPLKEYSDYNDNSLVNAIYIGNKSILFSGDVEKSRIKSLLNLNIGRFDLIKLPHHGEIEDNSLDFLKMVKPSYAIVTNDVLDPSINEYLNNIGSKIYYTSNSEIHFITNGKTLRVGE